MTYNKKIMNSKCKIRDASEKCIQRKKNCREGSDAPSMAKPKDTQIPMK